MELKTLTLNGKKYDSFAAPGDALLLDRNLVTGYGGNSNTEFEDGNVVLRYKSLNSSGNPTEVWFAVTTSETLVVGESYVLSFNCAGVPENRNGKSFDYKITGGSEVPFTLENGRITVRFTKSGTTRASITIDDVTQKAAERPTQAMVGDGIVLSDFVIYPAEHIKVDEKSLLRAVHPTLSYEQRTEMKALMDAYYNNRSTFGYDWSATRNTYANNSCWKVFECKNKDGKVVNTFSRFRLCCATFVELVWMGRKASDFVGKDGTKYSNAIDKAFDWGFYFPYRERANIGGASTVDKDGNVKYYNFRQPLGDGVDEYSYSVNTQYDADYVGDSSHPNAQSFKGFMMANDMAKELYKMGCEIPFSELMVGDLVFIGNGWNEPVNEWMFTNATRFRGIGHVAMVYEISDSGVLTLMDCTDAEFVLDEDGPYLSILQCWETHNSEPHTRARAINMLNNIVMCARHPAAWGKGNMAERETVDFMPRAVPNGVSVGGAFPLDFSTGSVTVEAGKWYTWDNHVGEVETTATVSAWEDIDFTTLYT